MLVRLLVLVSCVLVAILVLGILGINKGPSAVGNTYVPQLQAPILAGPTLKGVSTAASNSPQASKTLSDDDAEALSKSIAEHIPVYPGTQNLAIDTSLSPQVRAILFDTRDNYRTISDYYRTELTRLGWIRNVDSGSTFNMVWPNSAGILPWSLHFSIFITKVEQGVASLRLDVIRLPDPRKLPIYPGAEQVQVSDTENTPGYHDRAVKFLAPGSVAEVRDYYNTRLAQHGWWPTDTVTDTYAKFSYHEGGSEVISGNDSDVTLAIQSLSEKTTLVELHATWVDVAPEATP